MFVITLFIYRRLTQIFFIRGFMRTTRIKYRKQHQTQQIYKDIITCTQRNALIFNAYDSKTGYKKSRKYMIFYNFQGIEFSIFILNFNIVLWKLPAFSNLFLLPIIVFKNYNKARLPSKQAGFICKIYRRMIIFLYEYIEWPVLIACHFLLEILFHYTKPQYPELSQYLHKCYHPDSWSTM